MNQDQYEFHNFESVRELISSLICRCSGNTHLSALTLSGNQAEQNQLRYLRLLTPHTRTHKFEHQTWHHLPNYRDMDPVNNRSSMYTLSNAPIPRHFVIHPDWG